MSDDANSGGDQQWLGDSPTGWPTPLRGVTESVVATLGPNDLWNLAALGLHAPDSSSESASEYVTATTWGRTRTYRNFRRRGGGVVQFVTDPRDFVDAALTIREESEPVLASADAWVEVAVEAVDSGESGGTEWTEWRLEPTDSGVEQQGVRTINRGFAAVIDATVAVSRLDVDAYDTEVLLDRLDYFAETVERCGGPAEREAFERVDAVSDWRSRRE
ncbi:DUF447 domain-containing protein [Salinirubrum litoreum]|uniref:DUF447 domain-containing protein n=1 Tax=Salinirubrum litoreum TaxID=1126234 RepID=A0ABD5RBJ3_9EURY